jgi:site-specific DNA-methyltransferase (adenine-specific)
MTTYQILQGNSLELLKTLEDNSVDAIVTDPPYGLSQHSQGDIVNALTAWLAGEEYTHGKKGFMGKAWDSFVPSPMLFKECYRVLKHGGHILCFAGSRTQDLMSLSIRLAGFEMRDACLWLYGSGFPKGCNIAKGIDGVLGKQGVGFNASGYDGRKAEFGISGRGENFEKHLQYKPSDEAKQWEGWNTNLKPAYEPIIMARKPLDGTVVNNVLKHGVGGLNIDACRVGGEISPSVNRRASKIKKVLISKQTGWVTHYGESSNKPVKGDLLGRYPANIILDGSDSVEALFPETQARQASQASQRRKVKYETMGKLSLERSAWNAVEDYAGSASRYFYHAKASKADRDEGVNGMNTHATVKPTQLMRYLVKLVTPQGGLVLDPFMGSGSTGKACMLEQFNFVGMELSEEYVKIAEARIEHARQQRGLFNA